VVLIFEARVERGQQGSEKHRLTAGLPSPQHSFQEIFLFLLKQGRPG
jgi:hypothetical protein